MSTQQINIKQSDIFDRLSLLTHYTGFKNTADPSAFDRIATIDANDEALSRFWDQSLNALVIIISPFLKSIYYEKEVISASDSSTGSSDSDSEFTNPSGNISDLDAPMLLSADASSSNVVTVKVPGLYVELSMPSAWDSHLLPACQSAAENFLLARLAEQWYRITNAEGVAAQVADATASATELKILLYSKTRPAIPSSFTN